MVIAFKLFSLSPAVAERRRLVNTKSPKTLSGPQEALVSKRYV